MFAGNELIVGLWFLPVIVFIIVPLVVLLTWSVACLFKPLLSIKSLQKQGEEGLEGQTY